MAQRLYLLRASGNPVVQVLSLLVFGVALIGAVLMGAVIIAFVFGFAVIGAIVFSVRLWWLRRKMQRQAESGSAARTASDGRLIEAEYTVVKEREPQQRRRD